MSNILIITVVKIINSILVVSILWTYMHPYNCEEHWIYKTVLNVYSIKLKLLCKFKISLFNN